MTIDSDDIDGSAVADLARDMAQAAIARAEAKLQKRAAVVPPPVAAAHPAADDSF